MNLLSGTTLARAALLAMALQPLGSKGQDASLIQVAVRDVKGLSTPAPTMGPGQPCQCEGCGGFPLLDLDGNGCLVEEEVDRVDAMRGLFTGLDFDKNGCVNRTECAIYQEQHDLNLLRYTMDGLAGECDYGMYLPDQASVCIPCIGGSTSRRRSHTCTPCSSFEFDAGAFDSCVGGVYVTADASVGDTALQISDIQGLSAGDSISIASRNPGRFEEATIASVPEHSSDIFSSNQVVGPGTIQLARALTSSFRVYDPVTLACTDFDGVTLSKSYPCGCGQARCDEGEACERGPPAGSALKAEANGTAAGTSGSCIARAGAVPTPRPAASARGDPHLVSLRGEHFDVGHGGDFSLLRIPQDATQPAGLTLRCTIQAEFGKPCTTHITQVELGGLWLDNNSLEVRSYLRSQSGDTGDKFLGARIVSAQGLGAPWRNITDWGSDRSLVASGSGYEVTVSKVSWSGRRHSRPWAPNVAGQFEIRVRDTRSKEATKVIIRQDLAYQQHLSVAVRRLSALGREDIGGLIGLDERPASLAEVAPECRRHRSGLDGRRGPRATAPWQTRWTKVKEERGNQAGPADIDPEAKQRDAESRISSGGGEGGELMCVCESGRASLDEDAMRLEAQEQEEEAAYLANEGIMTDWQVGRLAEASWD
mmetsp:Transcript_89019/g.241453  ORF Transcript_89019/g.241453 Transcript_89019/m.241453 type:complete len:651 (-) Transcript_89019:187-2139(-)